jgi:hypothetical protein
MYERYCSPAAYSRPEFVWIQYSYRYPHDYSTPDMSLYLDTIDSTDYSVLRRSGEDKSVYVYFGGTHRSFTYN